MISADTVITTDRKVILTSSSPFERAHKLSEYLLSASTATVALQSWCRDRCLGTDEIEAEVIPAGVSKLLDDEVLDELRPGPNEPIRERRVHLRCGLLVLSHASIWYAPHKLTEDMNAALKHSKVPFGKVVAQLKPRRRTFSAKILVSREPACSPVDGPIQFRDGSSQQVSSTIVEHFAVVVCSQDQPLAVVREHYQSVLIS